MHDANCFITLTYDEDHIPEDWSLDKTVFQKFMKRLRKRFAHLRIRYFHCGEYGEQFGRPHYHACLFGIDFPDRVRFSESCDTSAILESVWGLGFCTVGDVNFESAAYVARYVMKKVTGEAALDHYGRVNPVTGEWFRCEPEYTTMSRRPGIGAPWLSEFGEETYRDDSVVMRGVEMKPPRFYDKQFELVDAERLEEVKRQRVLRGRSFAEERTPARLAVREKVKKAQCELLKRKLK